VLRGVRPEVAERIVAESDADGRVVIPPDEAASMAEDMSADIEASMLWWASSPDVPAELKPILSAQAVGNAVVDETLEDG
jgi:hypothetical protein